MNKLFCSKCGKEILDNASFCAFCGEKTKRSSNVGLLRVHDSQSIEKCFLIVNSILAVIIAICYVYVFNKWFESNNGAFDWCKLASKSLGNFLNWGICIFVCAQSLTFIYVLKLKVTTFLPIYFGTLLIIEGIVLKVLEVIHKDWSGSDISIVLFRIFGRTYSNMVGYTIIVGILLIISGVIMNAKFRENRNYY